MSGQALAGRRIVVTGGSKGIGAALVGVFAAEGARVVSMARDAATGEAVAASAGEETRFVQCDVSEPASVEAAFGTAREHLGGLDVLVHVAGVHVGAKAETITPELLTSLHRINMLGTMLANQAAFEAFAGAGGAIVNFGSEAGVGPVRNGGANAAYGASKAAVHSWTRHAAREWGSSGVTVNAVLPYMRTPMYDDYRAAMTAEQLHQHDAMNAQQIPIGGQLGDPVRDLGPVMVFLASAGAHFVTGQLLPVDGGLLGE